MVRWRDISIAKKLYVVIGAMGVLIGCELLTLRFAMHTLSAVRAFVEGEGTWSKAQKDAAFSLQRYALTGDEAEYRDFEAQLQIPAGDHLARTELLKPQVDMPAVRRGFLQGRIHPDDIDAIVDLLRRFSEVSYLARAIQVWTEADLRLDEFRAAGAQYHDLLRRGSPRSPDTRALQAALRRIGELNAELTRVEAEFSAVLGQGSRWMERVVISLLFLAVIMVESVGLTLTFLTTRALSRGLAEVNAAATRIGAGDFAVILPVRAQDELGHLAQAVNQMKVLLESSYRDLESRVSNRTRELQVMAKENERLYEEANAAVRMRDEFFSIASHELKTPITALNLNLQLLIRQLRPSETDPASPKIRTQLEACLRQSQRLSLLSEELMDLTRIRLGKFELKLEACDLAAIVRDAATILGQAAAKSESALEVRAPAPVTGLFDVTRLGQVVTNLISNAIKYGDAKPIVVNVRKQGAFALIEVSDLGVGIAPEDQDRVFERFERVDEKGSKAAGLGLGLYITRQIVEKHGGKISVRSRIGLGSIFTVEFPLGPSISA